MKSSAFVLLSIALVIVSWGSYGPLLRIGKDEMGGSHLLPFIFVGVAYFLVAVVAASAYLIWIGEAGNWSIRGVIWSFLAGVVTAVGALGVILAFTHKGNPIYVMPLIFGGAPVVNTIVTMIMSKTHREAGSLFYAGMILVIAGATTVLVFSPVPPKESSITMVEFAQVLLFVALTALCWGSYGPLLHKGQMLMQNSRMRPFICVGVAYCVIAILMPLLLRSAIGDHGHLSWDGGFWSLMGGIAGALGSLGVILAFTFGGKPLYVMPLVFGGAPVVNTFISISMAKDHSPISPFFYAGLIVVVAGAVSVLVFAPRGKPHPAVKKVPEKPAAEPAKSVT
jgi:drug/metabolite transporter (DMT)-like permease